PSPPPHEAASAPTGRPRRRPVPSGRLVDQVCLRDVAPYGHAEALRPLTGRGVPRLPSTAGHVAATGFFAASELAQLLDRQPDPMLSTILTFQCAKVQAQCYRQPTKAYSTWIPTSLSCRD